MGNFIFDLAREDTTRDYFVQMDLINDTCELTLYPIYMSGYLPYFMSPENGKALLEELNPQCDQLNITENGTGKLVFNITRDK